MRSLAALARIVLIGAVSILFGIAADAAPSAPARASVDTDGQSNLSEWLAVVRVHEATDVNGPNIVLGDVAEIRSADDALRARLQQLVLGRAALPGQHRELSVASIGTRIRQQRLPVHDILIEANASEIVVSTRARTVAGAVLVEAALEAVHGHVSTDLSSQTGDARWLLDCPVPEDVIVADGLLDIKIPRLSGSAPGGLVVSVEVTVDGAVQRTVMVRCDAILERDVLVASKSLKRHEELHADAIAVERQEFTSLPRGELLPLTAADDPAGWRVTRPIRPGAVLTFGMVEPVPTVRRGGRVGIVALLDGIEVSAPGVALADGQPGDVIKVENELSGQVIQALVVDEGLVKAVLH